MINMTFFQVVSIVSNIHPNSNPENGGEEKKNQYCTLLFQFHQTSNTNMTTFPSNTRSTYIPEPPKEHNYN